ncbi:SEL1-like repeat protein [Isorropodon fossajaponicum symbiont]|uniref:SEL1-like repeat protein n=1 Tax=Isorropodon fossajaponicum symbiont TaxID=883811 RepID=UPI0019169FD0|nr:SEL1-like repeat protein [Isorropodon fossajaponicum symbiont]
MSLDAIDTYKKACDDFNNANSCFGLGFMYKRGEGVRQSNIKALEHYGKAYDFKSQADCDFYAKLKKETF